MNPASTRLRAAVVGLAPDDADLVPPRMAGVAIALPACMVVTC